MFDSRNGVAAVEAAICLPLIALIIFSAMEISGGVFQDYDSQSAAYELSKVALRSENSCDDVQAAAAAILPNAGYENYSVEINVVPRTVNADSVDPPTVTTFSVPKTGSTTTGLEAVPRGTLLKLTLTVERPRIPGQGFMQSYFAGPIVCDCVFVKEF